METIPLSDCVVRTVYRLASRNLTCGVFDGQLGFIGIREKFGDKYLFKEYHWDGGPPYGTARPYEILGSIPGDIALAESLGTCDHKTRRSVAFDRTETEFEMYPGGPKKMKGWYYQDTGEFSKSIMPVTIPNLSLFLYLQSME